MNNSQVISITSSEESTLPLSAMMICAKVQKRISPQQLKIILQACLELDLSEEEILWVYESIHTSLSKRELDFFLSSSVMYETQHEKRRMIAWAVRFIRSSKKTSRIKNSIAILFKMIDLLLDRSKKSYRLKVRLLERYSKHHFVYFDKRLNNILDSIETEGSYDIEKKRKSPLVLLPDLNITLSKNNLDETPELFIQLLQGSLSLNKEEKMRVISQYKTLSEYQLDALKEVFTEENERFQTLKEENPKDIDKLEFMSVIQWLEIYNERKLIDDYHENVDEIAYYGCK